jgi:hypothetical protein
MMLSMISAVLVLFTLHTKTFAANPEDTVRKVLASNACLATEKYRAQTGNLPQSCDNASLYRAFRDPLFDYSVSSAFGTLRTAPATKAARCYLLGRLSVALPKSIAQARRCLAKNADTRGGTVENLIQKVLREDRAMADYCMQSDETGTATSSASLLPLVQQIADYYYSGCEQEMQSVPDSERGLPPIINR